MEMETAKRGARGWGFEKKGWGYKAKVEKKTGYFGLTEGLVGGDRLMCSKLKGVYIRVLSNNEEKDGINIWEFRKGLYVCSPNRHVL